LTRLGDSRKAVRIIGTVIGGLHGLHRKDPTEEPATAVGKKITKSEQRPGLKGCYEAERIIGTLTGLALDQATDRVWGKRDGEVFG